MIKHYGKTTFFIVMLPLFKCITANGTVCGDEEGKFTYHGRREDSVVHYALANEEAIEEVKKFRIEKSGVRPPVHC